MKYPHSNEHKNELLRVQESIKKISKLRNELLGKLLLKFRELKLFKTHAKMSMRDIYTQIQTGHCIENEVLAFDSVMVVFVNKEKEFMVSEIAHGTTFESFMYLLPNFLETLLREQTLVYQDSLPMRSLIEVVFVVYLSGFQTYDALPFLEEKFELLKCVHDANKQKIALNVANVVYNAIASLLKLHGDVSVSRIDFIAQEIMRSSLIPQYQALPDYLQPSMVEAFYQNGEDEVLNAVFHDLRKKFTALVRERKNVPLLVQTIASCEEMKDQIIK